MTVDTGRGECLFSIVIATSGRPLQLKRCLAAISRLHFPPELFEVVVVFDGGPATPESDLAKTLGDVHLRVMEQHRQGPSVARNTGSAAATGKYLTFIDDDCVPANDWLALLSEEVAQHPDAMIGGATVNALAGNIYSEASQSVVEYVYRYYNDSSAHRRMFFASNNLTVPRVPFLAAGGFDVGFRTAEDREFCARWQAGGRESRFASGVVMHHAHDLGLFSLLRQHFRYGTGAYAYWKKEAELTHRGLRVEPPRFYAGILRFPFATGKRSPASICALMILAQIANAAGFAFESLRKMMSRKPRAVLQTGAESA
jgi:glycosyltransferase involved in cell wall biosynthesis